MNSLESPNFKITINNTNNSSIILLQYWYYKCRIYFKCHKESALYYNNINKYLGLPIIVMGLYNATSLFSNYINQNQVLILTNGGISLLATILSGLQNYFDYSKISNMHLKISNNYNKINHTIQKILMYDKLLKIENNDINQKIVDSIINQIEFLQDDSPIIPDHIWMKYKNEIKQILLFTGEKKDEKLSDEIPNDILYVETPNDDKFNVKSNDKSIEIIYDNNKS
jgi:hypothetical protein